MTPGDVLRKRLRSADRLVGAAVGSGMAAEAAEAGEADFLMILNAGFFRTIGCGSMAALMPFANANELTWNTATRTVMPRVKSVPVLIGLCAQDPQMHTDTMFARLKENGFAGVTNFPSVGFIDGIYREALEEAGLGYEAEVRMLHAASKAGFVTIGFCFNAEEAEQLARAGVEVINLDLGFADWRRRDPEEHDLQMDEAVHLTNDVVKRVEAVRKKTPVMIYGGPVVLPHDTAVIYQRTRARGYIGGSTIERFPAAPLVTQTVRSFKRTAERDWEGNRLGSLIGGSPRMRELFEMIRLCAESDAPVLISGESGTGKELVAREVHRLSGRARRPLVTVNCGAISESLAMSELFGHERGAFTGAHSQHRGKFEQANQTTLFLDEMAELPVEVQASLLRVLQEGEIVRVGGDRTIPVDVRLVAATNRDLRERILDGRFRLDLYYRLSIVVLQIPSLRERREDIPELTLELTTELCRRYNLPVPNIPPVVLDAFANHDWPGNIRELRNAVERCLILGRGASFRTEWLQDHFEMAEALRDRGGAAPVVPRRGRQPDAQQLEEIIRRNGGNKSAAARELGVTRKTLYEWLSRAAGETPTEAPA